MAELYAGAEAGRGDAGQSVSVGPEGDNEAARPDRVLVTSHHALRITKELSARVLLDLQARGQEDETRTEVPCCVMFQGRSRQRHLLAITGKRSVNQ